jgi:Fe-S-cluster containining protein
MNRAREHRERIHDAARALDVDLGSARRGLRTLYRRADRALERRSSSLALPCHAGCDACCTSSPRLTPLEYAALVQSLHAHGRLQRALAAALAVHAERAVRIDAIDRPGGAPPDQALCFRCPVLDPRGRCAAYAARPMVCRLFGHSFDDAGHLYACDLVNHHLAGRELTLARARPWLQALRALPLTDMVQVIPAYAALFEAG